MQNKLSSFTFPLYYYPLGLVSFSLEAVHKTKETGEKVIILWSCLREFHLNPQSTHALFVHNIMDMDNVFAKRQNIVIFLADCLVYYQTGI